MLDQYSLPQWIQDMIEDASDEDKLRLRLYGYMLVTGIVFRVGDSNPETGVTTVPVSTINALTNEDMKELIAAYIKAAYGADEVYFFTTSKDRRISVEDRAYFHIQFQQKFNKARKRGSENG